MPCNLSCRGARRTPGRAWVRLSVAVDALNGRYGRTLIGYGQCGEPGGYVGAKIAYGRIPELEDFH